MKLIKNKKIIIGLAVILFILILIIIVSIKVILPLNYISSINKSYDLNQYENIIQYDKKINTIKNYLKNNIDEYRDIQYKIKYANAMVFVKNKQYDSAINELQQIESPNEDIQNKINDYKYELAKQYIDEKTYKKALELLKEVKNKEDITNLEDKIHYNLALQYFKSKNYKSAIEEAKEVKNQDYGNLKETIKQIYYEYGKDYFNKENYQAAISKFEIIKDYKDAKDYINKAYIGEAEIYMNANNYSQAKKIYDMIPNEAEYNGIKASKRKEQLNKIKNVLKVVGKKYATKTYCESRNVWKYDGRYDSWYIDKSNSSEYIEIDLKLNDNGTFTLTGTAYFYAFNNFSSLQKYCNASIISKDINIKNVKSIPSTYTIDENTKLLYSNGKFKIKYSKKDNYSVNFYNLYRSTVTY